jgi:pyridoxal/pyridoxine/pyridoxamine kinase
MAQETAKPEAPKEEWHETTLSEATIHNIQQAQFSYKKCVVDAMRKPQTATLESRHATDAVIRACEPVLGDIRKVYLDNNVPGIVADRHLKKLRIQVTRKVLEELMYAEAAKSVGHP